MDQRDIEQLLKAGEITDTVKSGDIFLLARPNVQRGDNYSLLLIKEGDLITQISQNLPSTSILKEAVVSLSVSQIRTLNSSPVQIVIAPGAGYAIEFVSGSFDFLKGDGNSSIGDFVLKLDTLTDAQANTQSTVSPTNNCFGRFLVVSNRNSVTPNKALMVSADQDSAAGTATATIYITYRLITL